MMQLLPGNKLMQKDIKKRFKVRRKNTDPTVSTILFEYDPEAYTLGTWLAERPGAE